MRMCTVVSVQIGMSKSACRMAEGFERGFGVTIDVRPSYVKQCGGYAFREGDECRKVGVPQIFVTEDG